MVMGGHDGRLSSLEISDASPLALLATLAPASYCEPGLINKQQAAR